MNNKTNLRSTVLSAETPTLFPEDIPGKIPTNHPVRLVNEVVNSLSLDHIISEYKGGGAPGFHPRMMIKVLFYAYLTNVYSCRKIERALHENIYFMWLSGNSTPDFRTINYFRGHRLKEHINDLFTEVVKLLQELGYVSLQTQYVDSARVEATTGRYTFVWRKNEERHDENLEAKIQSVLTDIEAQIKKDQQEPNRIETPRAIISSELEEKLNELNKRLNDGNQACQG